MTAICNRFSTLCWLTLHKSVFSIYFSLKICYHMLFTKSMKVMCRKFPQNLFGKFKLEMTNSI